MLFEEPFSRGERKAPFPAGKILSAAITGIVHALLVYGLYHAKINIKIIPFREDIQDVVIAPSDPLKGPTIIGGETLEGEEGEQGRSSLRQPAEKVLGSSLASTSESPGGIQRGEARSAFPIPALSSEFQKSLSSRFQRGSETALRITLGPKGSPQPGLPEDDLFGRSSRNLTKYLTAPLSATGGSPRGGYGTGSRPGGRQKAGISIPLEGYDLALWAEKVIAIIQQNWDLPTVSTLPPRAEVMFAVVIGKSGELSSLEFLEGSSLEVLDQAALRALRTSLPFPPLPDDFPADLLEAFFVFTYND